MLESVPRFEVIAGSGPDISSAAEPGDVTNHAATQFRKILLEVAKRRIEALKLYEPLPTQHEFHASKAPERIARGSNRSGKTLSAAVEIARAVTGCDPHEKYPEADGICYCVGKDEKHTGKVMFKYLCRAGAFKIIRDENTQQWRTYRPWLQADAKRADQAKPAPPLIPPRLIKHIAWTDKKAGIPGLISLHNGWEIQFFSSKSEPIKGTSVNLVWFDEEVENEEWYPEMAARLVDKSGLFIWSATPQAGTEQLYDLHELSLRYHGCEKPRVVEYVLLLDDNPHLTREQKQSLSDKLSNEDERRVRIGGEFAVSSYKVYPEFLEAIHEVPWFEIPANWSRYLVVDPGRQICAVLFAAVPPPELGDHVYLYDQLYIKDCDAEKLGRLVGEKASGQSFQAFIIDSHMGRVHESGSGMTVEDQYSEAFRKNNVKSVRTGAGFAWGSDDVDAGILASRSWLVSRGEKPVKLKILSDKMKDFKWEIKRYHYKREKNRVTDKPEQKNAHLLDCLRYLALYDPKWVKPPPVKKPEGYAHRILRIKAEKKRRQEGPSYVNLGPGKK